MIPDHHTVTAGVLTPSRVLHLQFGLPYDTASGRFFADTNLLFQPTIWAFPRMRGLHRLKTLVRAVLSSHRHNDPSTPPVHARLEIEPYNRQWEESRGDNTHTCFPFPSRKNSTRSRRQCWVDSTDLLLRAHTRRDVPHVALSRTCQTYRSDT